MKFSNKLSLVLLMIGMTVLIILSLVIYRLNYNLIIKSQSLYTQATADSIADDVDMFLAEKIKTGLTLANTPIIKKALQASNLSYTDVVDEKINESIQLRNKKWKSTTDLADDFILKYTDNPVAQVLKKQQTSLEGEYGEIFLTNKFGALVASTAKLSTFAHGHKYWWLGAYENGKGAIFFDDRGYDDSVGGYVLGLVVPVRNGSEIIGILKCNLNILGSISDLISRPKDQLLGTVKLTRSGGMIVFEEGFEPLSTQVHDSIFQKIKNKNKESFIFDDSGKMYLVGFAEIRLTTGGSGYGFGGSFESIDHKKGNIGESWYVLCYRPLGVIQAPTFELIRAILLSGTVIVVLLTLLSYLLGRRISRPLALLNKATGKIGKGDFEYRIDMTRNDEFGNLACSFNSMAESLQQSTTSISFLHEEVRRRTEAEQQALHTNELLQCIDQLRNQFVKEADPFLLFFQFQEHLLKLTDSEYGLVGDVLVDKEGNKYLKLYAISNLAWDAETNKLYKEYRHQGLEFRKLDNLFGLVVTSGKPVFSNDPANDSRGAGFPKGHPKISSFLGIPVYYGEQLVGEVGLANRPGGYDQAFLDWIAPIIAALGQIIVARWDREARQVAEHELTQLATTDPLTGATNRREFNTYLNTLMARVARYPENVTLLMLDIDHFKSVNDNYGHNAGDQILVELVQQLKSIIRQVDLLSRWGGEEFMILLPQTNIETGRKLAERIRHHIEEYIFSQPQHVTVSIGLTSLQEDDTQKSIIMRVDAALYQAKIEGRNCVVIG